MLEMSCAIMKTMPVAQSSHIQHFSYDPESSTLTVEFVNGSVYSYAGVPQAEYDRFAQAGSKGTHLHAYIIPAVGKGSRVLPAMRSRGR